MNLYDVLNIPHNASNRDIKKAYHKLLILYHPDKNNSQEAKEKLEEIKFAYEILSNETSRKKYSMLDKEKSNNLWLTIQSWIRNLDKEDIFSIISLSQDSKFKQFLDIFENLNLTEIISWFHHPTKINPSININDFTESDTNKWTSENSLKLFILPFKYLKENPLDIHIYLDVSINDILSKSIKKLKISRTINDIEKIGTFYIPLNYPYIIFPNAGDIKDNQYGNLIFFINIKSNDIEWKWDNNNIVIEKYISLYQMLYGLDLSFNLKNDTINFYNYIPQRDGWDIILLELDEINIKVKLILKEIDYNKQEILYQYFN